MNIFQALREQHDSQRTLVDSLIETHGDTRERHRLYLKLKDELEAHAAAEERYFYAPLMQCDNTMDKARHGVAEHHEIDELLEKIEDTDYSSPAWLTYAKQLNEKVHHHLDEEEHEVFQMAGKVLTDKQKQSLANDYQTAYSDQLKAAV